MEKKRVEVMGSLSLLLVAVIWGTGFIASQMALDANLSSAFIMFVRFAIAALIVGLVFHRDLKQKLKQEHWKGGTPLSPRRCPAVHGAAGWEAGERRSGNRAWPIGIVRRKGAVV